MAKIKMSKDTIDSLAPKISKPMLRWLITYFPIGFLRDYPDAFKALALPLNLFASWILPDDGLSGQVASQMFDGFPETAAARVKDWEEAKGKLFATRKQKAKKQHKRAKPVEDTDYADFKAYLTFMSRDVSLKQIRDDLGELGKNIADKLGNIRLGKWFSFKLDWHVDIEKFQKKLDEWSADMKKLRQSSKRPVAESGTSRLFDRWTEKMKMKREQIKKERGVK